MDYIGILKGRIEKKCNDVTQRDVLSLMYLLVFILSIFIAMAAVIPYAIKIFNIIFDYAKYIIVSFIFNNTFDYNYLDESINNLLNSFNNIEFLEIIFKMIVPTMITIIYIYCFENSKFWNELIFILIYNISLSLIFLDKDLIGIIILTIILLVIINPLGSGKYFNFLKKIRYLIYIYKDFKINKAIIYWGIIKLGLLITICSCLAYYTSSFISFYFGLIIFITITFRIYIGNSNNVKVAVVKKIILYIVVLLIYILLNYKITVEIEKLLALLITMYFSFDRIFSISKEINDLILTESALYFYEDEDISSKTLSELYLDLKFMYNGIDEISLVIQILLRFNILTYKKTFREIDRIHDELLILCDYYENTSYTSFKLMVGFISLFFSNGKISEHEYHEKIETLMKEIENLDNQKIFPLDLVFQYIYILRDKKEFDKIVSIYNNYLEYNVKNLDNEVLQILIESFDEIGNKNLSEGLKKYLST